MPLSNSAGWHRCLTVATLLAGLASAGSAAAQADQPPSLPGFGCIVMDPVRAPVPPELVWQSWPAQPDEIPQAVDPWPWLQGVTLPSASDYFSASGANTATPVENWKLVAGALARHRLSTDTGSPAQESAIADLLSNGSAGSGLAFNWKGGSQGVARQGDPMAPLWQPDSAMKRAGIGTLGTFAPPLVTSAQSGTPGFDAFGVMGYPRWAHVGVTADLTGPERSELMPCSEVLKLALGKLPGRNGGNEMNTGTGPNTGQLPGLQAGLTAGFAASMGDGLPKGIDSSPAVHGDCRKITWDSLDWCFLPNVGLLSPVVGGDVTCSGTIVGPRYVLTAAHCVCVFLEDGPKVVVPGGILVGTHGGMPSSRLLEIGPEGGATIRIPNAMSGAAAVIVPVEAVKVFGNDCSLAKGINDLALITVAAATPFPMGFRAKVMLPPPVDIVVNIAGFGRDPYDNAGVDSLAMLTNPSLGKEQRNLKRYLSVTFLGIAEGMLRLKGDDMADSCEGDSGSGAYLRLADGTLGVFGVLSGGAEICVGMTAAAYVDISDPRFADLLADVPRADADTNLALAEDFNFCIGDRCENDYWLRMVAAATPQVQ
ncbi:MAG: trypsin-like serine protease [Devosia sp.]